MYAKTHQKRTKTLLNGLNLRYFARFATRLSARIRVRQNARFSSQPTHVTTLAAVRQRHGLCLETAKICAGRSKLQRDSLGRNPPRLCSKGAASAEPKVAWDQRCSIPCGMFSSELNPATEFSAFSFAPEPPFPFKRSASLQCLWAGSYVLGPSPRAYLPLGGEISVAITQLRPAFLAR